MVDNKKEGKMRFVSFSLDKEYYGQDIRYVREVTRVETITEMPGTKECILGVVNLRGKIIPTLDLRIKLGIDPIGITSKSRLIIVEYHSSDLALLVDNVHHVLEIALTEISPPPNAAANDRNAYINGIGQVEGDLVFFLDIEKIFRDDDGSAIDANNIESLVKL